MSTDPASVSDEQLKDAQRAFDISALNGIMCLAAGLRGRGLLSDDQVQSLHHEMSAPLSLDVVADNPAVQLMQNRLDELFAALLRCNDPEE